MRLKQKITGLSLLCVVVFATLVPGLVLAAQTQYEPLAPIKGISEPGQKITAATYLPAMFRLGIGVASALAVLAIAYGGIKYMTSDVVTSKSGAIETIKNALLGLFLAIGAFLLLSTIDPQLTGNSAIQRLTNLSAPALPSPPPPPAPPDGYRLTYYRESYKTIYQEYEFELRYISPANNNLVLVRYATKSACEDARSAAATAPNTGSSCTRVVAYDDYTHGTLITDPSDYTVKEPVTLNSTSATLCSSDVSFIKNNPDRYTVLSECQRAPSGEPTSVTKTTREECRITASLYTNVVITENCVPFYNTP